MDKRRCNDCGTVLERGVNWYECFADRNSYVCKACNRARCRQYYKEHKEQEKARSRQYHREHKERINARQRQYRKEHREQEIARNRQYRKEHIEQERARERQGWLRRGYGLAPSDYEALLAKQGGVCAICGGINEGESHLSVDHDHSTGAIRGLLCIHCNTLLGFAKDNTAILEAAIEYLRESEETGGGADSSTHTKSP